MAPDVYERAKTFIDSTHDAVFKKNQKCVLQIRLLPFLAKLKKLLEQHSLSIGYEKEISFYLIGSALLSCFRDKAIPKDTDILIRYKLYIDQAEFHKINPFHVKLILDQIRDAIETIGLELYNQHPQKTEELTIKDIFTDFFEKKWCVPVIPDPQKSQGPEDRFGMVRFGKTLEFRYGVDFIITEDKQVIRTLPGFESNYVSRQDDLYVDLNPVIQKQKVSPTDLVLYSHDHEVSDVIQDIKENRIFVECITGGKFFALLKKFSFAGSLLEQDTLEKTFLCLVDGQWDAFKFKVKLHAMIEGRERENRTGCLVALLNIHILANRTKKSEVEEVLQTVLSANLFMGKSPTITYCLGLLLALVPTKDVREGFALIRNYEKCTYKLLLPKDPYSFFCLFLQNAKQNLAELFWLYNDLHLKHPGVTDEESLFLVLLMLAKELVGKEKKQAFLEFALVHFPVPFEKAGFSSEWSPQMSPREDIALSIETEEDMCAFVASLENTEDARFSIHALELLPSIHNMAFERKLRCAIHFALYVPFERLPAIFAKLAPPELCDEILCAFQAKEGLESLIRKFLSSNHPCLIQAACELWHQRYEQLQSIKIDVLFAIRFIPALHSILQQHVKAEKDPLFVALKLEMHQLKNVQEFENLTPSSIFGHPQQSYILQTLSTHSIQLVLSCPNRSELKKMASCLLALPLEKKEDVLLAFLQRALQFRELFFDILPLLVAHIHIPAFQPVMQKHLQDLPLKEMPRVLQLLKENGYAYSETAVGQSIQRATYQYLLSLETAPFDPAFLKFCPFLVDLALIEEIILKRLQKKTAIPSLFVFLQAIPVALLEKNAAILQECIEQMYAHVEENQNFKKIIAFLAGLPASLPLPTEAEKLFAQLLEKWKQLPSKEVSEGVAKGLLQLHLRIPNCKNMRSFTVGCARGNSSLTQWFFKKIKELHQGQQLPKEWIAFGFLQQLLWISFHEKQFSAVSDLFTECIETKIFDSDTPADIWFEAITCFLMALTKLQERTEGGRENDRLQWILQQPFMQTLLKDPKHYYTRDFPFVAIVLEGCKFNMSEHLELFTTMIENMLLAPKAKGFSTDNAVIESCIQGIFNLCPNTHSILQKMFLLFVQARKQELFKRKIDRIFFIIDTYCQKLLLYPRNNFPVPPEMIELPLSALEEELRACSYSIKDIGLCKKIYSALGPLLSLSALHCYGQFIDRALKLVSQINVDADFLYLTADFCIDSADALSRFIGTQAYVESLFAIACSKKITYSPDDPRINKTALRVVQMPEKRIVPIAKKELENILQQTDTDLTQLKKGFGALFHQISIFLESTLIGEEACKATFLSVASAVNQLLQLKQIAILSEVMQGALRLFMLTAARFESDLAKKAIVGLQATFLAHLAPIKSAFLFGDYPEIAPTFSGVNFLELYKETGLAMTKLLERNIVYWDVAKPSQ